MSEWDSELYLRFGNERTRPALDLALSVSNASNVGRVIDIGCGPGNSTEVLSRCFANASIIGVDNSQKMIDKASVSHPGLGFRLLDVNSELEQLDERFDLVFSNACLQWLPDQKRTVRELFGLLDCGGVLAVQVPRNAEAPLYRMLETMICESKWGLSGVDTTANTALEPNEYYDTLSGLTQELQLWEKVYYHKMPSHRALVEWVRGTRLRPYLELLGERGDEFLDELTQRITPLYPKTADGQLLFSFRRLFFTARRS